MPAFLMRSARKTLPIWSVSSIQWWLQAAQCKEYYDVSAPARAELNMINANKITLILLHRQRAKLYNYMSHFCSNKCVVDWCRYSGCGMPKNCDPQTTCSFPPENLALLDAFASCLDFGANIMPKYVPIQFKVQRSSRETWPQTESWTST